MKIKLLFYIAGFFLVSSCNKLDVPPMNIIQDYDIFGSPENVQLYLARLYNYMPVQDFRYSIKNGFNDDDIQAYSGETGEALSRQSDGYADEFYNNGGDFYSIQFKQIRQVNYFIEILPDYASNFSETDLTNWTAEAHFIRAYSYFALVKRYGGVPIMTNSVQITGGAPESYAQKRNSEEEVWDLVNSDLDIAINGLPEKSETGRANKYAAAALKSRAMLHAACIAKYNQIQQFDGSVRVQGIPAEKADYYFQAAYDASLILEGKYSLYKTKWIAGDKAAQMLNFKQLFFDKTSPENILVKDYYYPDVVHSYDCYMVPRQFQGPDGYAAMLCPTLDFVEMFDGIQRDNDGKITGLNPADNTTYLMFDNVYDLFKDAEPRLLATVLVPGGQFKKQTIDIRAGIFTGDIPTDGLEKLIDETNFLEYPDFGGKLVMTKQASTPVGVEMPDGTTMNASGACGPFLNDNAGAMSGFSIRKYLNEDMAIAKNNMSTQTYIDLRYAEVLLNRAEAAYELGNIDDAYNSVIQIQERAGANITAMADFNLNVIRKERRKELAFENNIYFDLKRWRIMQDEMTNRYYFGLFPFLSSQTGKYFFDRKAVNREYNMQEAKNYYQSIPGDALAKNKLLIQNFGY